MNDLLSDWVAARRIEYSDGSQLVILTTFDFQKYGVRTITVEYNYMNNRISIRELLSKNGFEENRRPVAMR